MISFFDVSEGEFSVVRQGIKITNDCYLALEGKIPRQKFIEMVDNAIMTNYPSLNPGKTLDDLCLAIHSVCYPIQKMPDNAPGLRVSGCTPITAQVKAISDWLKGINHA